MTRLPLWCWKCGAPLAAATRRLAALLLLGAGLIAGVSACGRNAATEDTPPEYVEVPVSTPQVRVTRHPRQQEIDRAVERGVAHLKQRLLGPKGTAGPDAFGRFADSAPVGRSALAGLALLEARVPPDDPAIARALAEVRKRGPDETMIYSLGAILFFLNRLQDAGALSREDAQLRDTLTFRLVAGQLAGDGRWSYHNPPISAAAEKNQRDQLAADTYQPAGKGRHHPSHSMTQFALLALWGGHRHHLPVRPALLAAAERFHETQYPDGTWEYFKGWGDGKILHDSNTCAGLMALAMEKALTEDRQFQGRASGGASAARAEEMRDRAFAHLAKVIGRKKGDPGLKHRYTGTVFGADAAGDYYFLWCLERVAMIYGKQTIGGKDWYSWGVDVLLENQKQDGSWVDRHGDVADTCFALLFLTRANLAKDLTDKLQELLAARQQPVPPAKE